MFNIHVICAFVAFLKYSLQVIDYAKLVQPRFDKALQSLRSDTIAEATEAAIKAVKEQLLTKLQAKRQGELPLLNARSKLRSTVQPGCLRARTWFARLDPLACCVVQPLNNGLKTRIYINLIHEQRKDFSPRLLRKGIRKSFQIWIYYYGFAGWAETE